MGELDTVAAWLPHDDEVADATPSIGGPFNERTSRPGAHGNVFYLRPRFALEAEMVKWLLHLAFKDHKDEFRVTSLSGRRPKPDRAPPFYAAVAHDTQPAFAREERNRVSKVAEGQREMVQRMTASPDVGSSSLAASTAVAIDQPAQGPDGECAANNAG